VWKLASGLGVEVALPHAVNVEQLVLQRRELFQRQQLVWRI
jgi:hypothetical protein